jgi:hypothetical protein
MRTFETLSLAAERAEAPGRLTRPLQPAGFEALGGIALKAPVTKKAAAPPVSAAARHKEEAARQKEEAARKKREAAVKKAEGALERARRRVAAAEAQLRQTRDQAD